ncbi:MAG TPA: WecB/TagA/CpsF family glycosyltransferase [Polyangia bacterium]|jgi:N-acetylglucosaminyldiphosphoundecaprenol N-acetyl-beta-D-mannosaminyltransferase|nr:WecB/TagA/CpsF family glycosyltransferase [Polyangia bacterium]
MNQAQPQDRDARAPFPTCDLLGMPIARTDSAGLIDYLFARLSEGRGGWLVTANLDFLRRHAHDAEARQLYAAADLRVADGFPLVWAARLQGDDLPGRVTGADLVWHVAERAAREGRSIFFLGGDADTALRAGQVLQGRWPALKVAGHASPNVDRVPTPAQLAALRAEVQPAKPDIVLVAMGSPKQENLIQGLRGGLPATWMIGVGATFSFVAGDVRRAPRFVQRMNLEWLWRLTQEPRRLFKRYIVEDLPFAFELFARSFARRFQKRG